VQRIIHGCANKRGIRFAKEKQAAKIDGCVALNFAVLAVIQHGRPSMLSDAPTGTLKEGRDWNHDSFDNRRLSGHYTL
jgi:hypothetical protein